MVSSQPVSNAPVCETSLYAQLYAEPPALQDEPKLQITVILYIPEGTNNFRESLRSVVAQEYTNFDLIIAAFTEEFASSDNEFKCPIILCNKSFGEEIMSIISIVKSKVIYILKAGDTLPSHALQRYADTVLAGASFIYADEALWDFENNASVRSILKPDFSRFYELTRSYLGEAICCRRSVLIRYLPILRLQESFPLFMRELSLSAICDAEPVHIEDILLFRNSKNKKNGFDVRSGNGIPSPVPLLTVSLIIVVSEPSNALLCARSLTDSISGSTEVFFLYDTDTCDLTAVLDGVSDFNYRIVSSDSTKNKSVLINLAANRVTGDILLIVQDTLHCDATAPIEEMLKCFRYDFVGAVSPKILQNDGTIAYAGAIVGASDFTAVPFSGKPNEPENPLIAPAFVSRETSVLSESCFAVRTKLWKHLNGLDSERFPSKFAVLDFAFRIREAGFSSVFCADCVLTANDSHWAYKSVVSTDQKEYLNLIKQWSYLLLRDPYFTESMKRIYLKKDLCYFHFYSNKHSALDQLGKNILLISHELTMTGAPIALHHVAKTLLRNGDYPVFASPCDGKLREEITQDGIPVLIDQSIAENNLWINYASNFDMVIVCTIVNINAIKCLERTTIPVLWWVHEAKLSYDNCALEKCLPYSVKKNIRIFCGGNYARKILVANRPAYDVEILLYPVPDYSDQQSNTTCPIFIPEGKFLFSIIGNCMERKGQDIFAEAIKKMSDSDRDLCVFLIIGNPAYKITRSKKDKEVYEKILQLKSEYPDKVIVANQISHIELMSVYKCSDCVVCSSRDDPMPIFMAEALMFSKICICSENAGTADLLEDGVNGFVYSGNDSTKLAQKMTYVLNHAGELDSVRKAGRHTYDEYFSMQIFTKNINSIIAKLVQG